MLFISLASLSSHTSPTLAIFESLPQNSESLSQASGGEKFMRSFHVAKMVMVEDISVFHFICVFLIGLFFLDSFSKPVSL